MRPPASARPDPRLLRIARDPRILPGVHRSCDEWCDYCPVTDRCLAFRFANEFRRRHGRTPNEPPFRSAAESLQFLRALAAVEGPSLLADFDRRHAPIDLAADDMVVARALEYATRSIRFVEVETAVEPEGSPGAGPTPAAVVLRFRSRIYFKTTRALVGRALTANGRPEWYADASTCATQALAGIARSGAALTQFPDGAERAALLRLLDLVRLEIERRFPHAPALVASQKAPAARNKRPPRP
jgi:hypothetical protein